MRSAMEIGATANKRDCYLTLRIRALEDAVYLRAFRYPF